MNAPLYDPTGILIAVLLKGSVDPETLSQILDLIRCSSRDALDLERNGSINNLSIDFWSLLMNGHIQIPARALSIQLPRGDVKVVNLTEILYIKGEGPFCEFILIDQNIKSIKGLGYYSPMLERHPDFHKFSQSLIVNRMHMERYKHRDLKIIMKMGMYYQLAGEALRHLGL